MIGRRGFLGTTGAFTCIQVPSLRYCTTLGGRENASRFT